MQVDLRQTDVYYHYSNVGFAEVVRMINLTN